MAITIWEEFFNKQSAIAQLKNECSKSEGGSLLLEGLYSSAKAFAIAASVDKGVHTILLNSREDALHCASDLYRLVDKESVYFYPAYRSGQSGRGEDSISQQVQRTATVDALINGSSNPLFVVTYPEAVSQLIVDKQQLQSAQFKIGRGDTLSHQLIKETLSLYNFKRVDFVAEPGQFAIRGGIIDLFSYSYNRPYRVEFFGDHVERIRVFEIDSQRSIEEVESVEIYSNIYDNETLLSSTIFDYCGEESTIWVSDLLYFQKEIEELNQEEGGEKLLSLQRFNEELESGKLFLFGPLPQSYSNLTTIKFNTSPQPIFHKNFDLLYKDILGRIEEGYRVAILSENSSQIERLKEIFSSISKKGSFSALDPHLDSPEEHFESEPQFNYYNLSIHNGFIDHNSKICLYTDHQIFERYRRVKALRAVEKSERLTINELSYFNIGDYIVHIDHGIGQFGGLVKQESDGIKQESLKLLYRDGDAVFVSIHGLHRIARYKSRDAQPPRLHKLASGAWQRLKERTKSKVKEIAIDLTEHYSKRVNSKGFAFSEDSYMQAELESSFIYEDTPDQLKATKAVKEDMEREYPMDRLICGDVGFGKTEIAIRAAFKAAADNKQVALLVPTTILALQHYNTFSERLKEFPVNINYLSRLRSRKDIVEISKSLAEGKIDIIIGTHRLLNREIAFKDLGLLIIDEEQKFGVAAKERLRELKLNVDTLSLTATPIPRTLQFSLMGARDLSIIGTPPPNRLPIETEVIDFNEEFIKEAIDYELERGGQLFFVHNRVEDIESVAEIVSRLAPRASITICHGQMEARVLERRVLDFMRGDYDIMVATSIIENGIDIANANTIIINQAQNFGLSDLHQLRGRVGRSNVRAFCYLIIPSMEALSEDARRRIRAIETFTELGSGFNIAMQDLDIRGAGNLFGAEQSGFVADMGFETYQRILAEAFAEIKEEQEEVSDKPVVIECSVDTDLELLIPDSYLSLNYEKIRLYKELDSIDNEEDLLSFIESVEDRYGPIPTEMEQLTYVVRLRWLGVELGFEKITLKSDMMIAWFVSNQHSTYFSSDRFAQILKFLQEQPKRFRIKEQNEKLYIVVQKVTSVVQAYNILLEMRR